MARGGSGNVVPSIVGAEHIGPEATGDNIEAKRVAVYQWNGTSWVRTPYGGSAALATRIDEASATVTYIGKAATGSTADEAVWQIQKIDESSGTIITWADGDANFNNVWDDRASITYS